MVGVLPGESPPWSRGGSQAEFSELPSKKEVVEVEEAREREWREASRAMFIRAKNSSWMSSGGGAPRKASLESFDTDSFCASSVGFSVTGPSGSPAASKKLALQATESTKSLILFRARAPLSFNPVRFPRAPASRTKNGRVDTALEPKN